jgi:hypothetical protein
MQGLDLPESGNPNREVSRIPAGDTERAAKALKA